MKRQMELYGFIKKKQNKKMQNSTPEIYSFSFVDFDLDEKKYYILPLYKDIEVKEMKKIFKPFATAPRENNYFYFSDHDEYRVFKLLIKYGSEFPPVSETIELQYNNYHSFFSFFI